MNNAVISAVTSMFLFAVSAVPGPASAESFDASTIACEGIAAAYQSKTETDISFINGILNWMGGYHATEAQGTVVDWAKLSKSFDETIAFCAAHTNVGVTSASERFMGENIEEASPAASDLAIITCEKMLTDKHLIENAGDTFMWLAYVARGLPYQHQ